MHCSSNENSKNHMKLNEIQKKKNVKNVALQINKKNQKPSQLP